MEIEKFKLVDNGSSGIEVWGQEYLRSTVNKRMSVIDLVHRRRRTAVSKDITQRINRLKYYFLNITGHWVKPYNKFFD